MKKAFLSTLLTLALVMTMSMPVLAEDYLITSDSSVDVTIQATVDSTFEVTIPKEIVLTNAEGGSGEYTATITTTAKADIGTSQKLTVEPSVESFNLVNSRATENNTAVCTVTKGKTEFIRDELNQTDPASAEHNLSATLTPGSWSGTLTFNIELK